MKHNHFFFKYLIPGLLAILLIITFQGRSLAANVTAKVDLSEQRMSVYVNNRRVHSWKISSGRKGYRTPKGHFRPKRMYRRYFSKKYNNAPMPNAIFFHGGYAIHGTNAVSRLGRPASHGCIRLSRAHAKKLFKLVQHIGPNKTRIVIKK